MDHKTNRNTAHPSKNKEEKERIKIKSSVISPPEPTPHPKDYESIDY